MELNLGKKISIVTGGAGTIGRAIAHRLLQEGAIVVIADVDVTHGSEAENELRDEFGGRVQFRQLDLRSERDVREVVGAVVGELGGVDIIINNAATAFFQPLITWNSLDALDEHYNVGLRGPVALVQEAWRQSPRSLGGSVVNVSSIAGHVAEPGAVAYSTIKAAQKGFTLSCAIEMAPHGGWAVTVSPGHTWAGSHRLRADASKIDREQYERASPNVQATMFGRLLEPADVAAWIALCASPLGKLLTGQDLRITCGVEAGGFHRSYKTSSEPASDQK